MAVIILLIRQYAVGPNTILLFHVEHDCASSIRDTACSYRGAHYARDDLPFCRKGNQNAQDAVECIASFRELLTGNTDYFAVGLQNHCEEVKRAMFLNEFFDNVATLIKKIFQLFRQMHLRSGQVRKLLQLTGL